MYKYLLLGLLLIIGSPVFGDIRPVARSIEPPALILSLVKEKAEKYNIPFIIPLVIIQEESKYKVRAINYNDGGEGCHSKGLVQINSCYHNYSDEQVYDEEFAIEFLVKNLAKNKCRMWSTCPIAKGIKITPDGS